MPVLRVWDGTLLLVLVSVGRHFASDRGGIECFRIARRFLLVNPHILGFGDEKVTENGQKQKVSASDKPVLLNLGSLARQHFR